jgi:hypothetical protein
LPSEDLGVYVGVRADEYADSTWPADTSLNQIGKKIEGDRNTTEPVTLL